MLAFVLNGYIVQEVSGIPFSEYIQKRVTDPLEMYSSTFDVPTAKDTDLAMGYSYSDGQYTPGSFWRYTLLKLNLYPLKFLLLKFPSYSVPNWYVSDPSPAPDSGMKSTAGSSSI